MTAGFLVNAVLLAVIVAVSYPVAAGAVVATGGGLYAARGVLRRATYERTVQVCRSRVCLQFQVRLG